MYLFDTDTVSNILKKTPSMRLIRKLAAVPFDQQFTTTITVGEMVYGALKSGRADYFITKLEKLVWPNIQILPFDESAARIYGKLRSDTEKKGISLSEPDMRIASIALNKNLVVVTGNVKHFSKIPGIVVENWI